MKFWICLIISVWNLYAFGQIHQESPLNQCYIDKELIVKHGIQSLTVFSEMDENGIGGESMLSGKLQEYEFDENGNTLYKLTAHNGGNGPFLYYDKGSRPEYSRYNERGLLLQHVEENFREFWEFNYDYDVNDNLTLEEIKSVGDHDSYYKRSFEWMDGKMIKTVDLSHTEAPSSTTVYDENGHFIEEVMKDYRWSCVYQQVGDTLTSTSMVYRSDTLASSLRFSHFVNDRDRIVYSSERNQFGELLNEVRVTYDKSGNVINSQSQELMKEDIESNEPPQLLSIETHIVNKYDDRGFLTKQLFYRSSWYRPEKLLVQVNYYCYDTAPLIYKFEKGAISKNEEIIGDY